MAYLIFALALLVNGATDAANSVTGVVAGGVLSLKKASLLAGGMNLAGMTLFYLLWPAVAQTVEGMAAPAQYGETVLVCVLLSVVLWSGGAWLFGIPTSESHGMLAGMAGASAALGAIPDFLAPRWLFVYGGVLLSAVLGALFGGIASALSGGRGGRKTAVAGCMASAFLHGAQDGQKFLALAVSCSVLRPDIKSALLCAAVMCAGTLAGGGRIVGKLGREMTDVTRSSAVASDIACAAALLFLTIIGMPASTTQVRACSLAGASVGEGRGADVRVLLSLAAAWITTFPCCYALSFFITKAALKL